MIFTNYKRPNPYKTVLDEFTDTNLHFGFGVFRSSSTIKYRWVADYLFKNRNNTLTNKHRMFVGFFSNKDMVLSEYGNIAELQNDTYMSIYFDGKEKTKLPDFIYELTSGRYKRIGQEYAEFDEIEYIDPSDTLFANYNLDDSGTASATINSYSIYDPSASFDNENIKQNTNIIFDNNQYTIDSKSDDYKTLWFKERITSSGGRAWNFDVFNIVLGVKRYIDSLEEYRRVIDTNHRFGDAPIFVAAGYRYRDFESGIDMYAWNNMPDWTEINYNNFKIILNDDEKDLYTHKYFLQKVASSTPLLSGVILIDLTGIGTTPNPASTIGGAGTSITDLIGTGTVSGSSSVIIGAGTIT